MDSQREALYLPCVACPAKHRPDRYIWRFAGQGHQHILVEEVSLAASALSSEEVRGCDLPAVRTQSLAVITNLISLAGMLLMPHLICCMYASMRFRGDICIVLVVSV